MSKKDLSETDRAAWAAILRSVKPLSGRRAAPVRIRSIESGPMPAVPDTPRRSPYSVPQNRQNERQVRRGKQPISASFDLHGHTQDSAWRALPGFLSQQRALGSRCVIIITGKGKQGDGVLRKNFLHWLETSEARNLVSGYAPAHPRHGGSGAWYVFLRKAGSK